MTEVPVSWQPNNRTYSAIDTRHENHNGWLVAYSLQPIAIIICQNIETRTEECITEDGARETGRLKNFDETLKCFFFSLNLKVNAMRTENIHKWIKDNERSSRSDEPIQYDLNCRKLVAIFFIVRTPTPKKTII